MEQPGIGLPFTSFISPMKSGEPTIAPTCQPVPLPISFAAVKAAPGEVREIDGHFAQRGAVIGVAKRDITSLKSRISLSLQY